MENFSDHLDLYALSTTYAVSKVKGIVTRCRRSEGASEASYRTRRMDLVISFDSENDSDSGSTTNTFYRRSRSRSRIKINSQISTISNNQSYLIISKTQYGFTSLLPRFLEISEKSAFDFFNHIQHIKFNYAVHFNTRQRRHTKFYTCHVS